MKYTKKSQCVIESLNTSLPCFKIYFDQLGSARSYTGILHRCFVDVCSLDTLNAHIAHFLCDRFSNFQLLQLRIIVFILINEKEHQLRF